MTAPGRKAGSLPLLFTRKDAGAATTAPKGVAGVWQGVLEGVGLRLQLHIFAVEGGKFTGKLDSLDQGANGLACDNISLKASAFHFEVPSVGGAYDGTLNTAADEISGTWTQHGVTRTLNFKRGDKPAAQRRPQNPTPPYPYKVEEVNYPSTQPGITLAGTLTIPQGRGPFPAALLIAAVAAARVLGQEMFDVQLRGALALTRGSIAEMQTSEGKTLGAVPAVAWWARQRQGVHVMTVNDYLARRDARWMGDVYRFLGLSVAYVQQGMTQAERRAAYASDITYATANEIGFDVLRDRLAQRVEEQVHRSFATAVIDEVDSILIDEARIPLVIAGGEGGDSALAYVADQVVRHLLPSTHYTVDVGGHNAALTDSGIRAVEIAFGCQNLFDESNLRIHSAVQDSLHAHALLRRDVDYLVKDGAIEMVDEFKGRIALDRRWPAGLHTAVEAKEGVAAKSQGSILGSTTIQHLLNPA